MPDPILDAFQSQADEISSGGSTVAEAPDPILDAFQKQAQETGSPRQRVSALTAADNMGLGPNPTPEQVYKQGQDERDKSAALDWAYGKATRNALEGGDVTALQKQVGDMRARSDVLGEKYPEEKAPVKMEHLTPEVLAQLHTQASEKYAGKQGLWKWAGEIARGEKDAGIAGRDLANMGPQEREFVLQAVQEQAPLQHGPRPFEKPTSTSVVGNTIQQVGGGISSLGTVGNGLMASDQTNALPAKTAAWLLPKLGISAGSAPAEAEALNRQREHDLLALDTTRQLEAARESKRAPVGRNYFEKGLYGLAGMAPKLAGAALVAAITKNPMAAAVFWGSTGMEETRAGLADAGYNRATQDLIAPVSGIIQGFLMSGAMSRAIPALAPKVAEEVAGTAAKGVLPRLAEVAKRGGLDALHFQNLMTGIEGERLLHLAVAEKLDPAAPPVDWPKEFYRSASGLYGPDSAAGFLLVAGGHVVPTIKGVTAGTEESLARRSKTDEASGQIMTDAQAKELRGQLANIGLVPSERENVMGLVVDHGMKPNDAIAVDAVQQLKETPSSLRDKASAIEVTANEIKDPSTGRVIQERRFLTAGELAQIGRLREVADILESLQTPQTTPVAPASAQAPVPPAGRDVPAPATSTVAPVAAPAGEALGANQPVRGAEQRNLGAKEQIPGANAPERGAEQEIRGASYDFQTTFPQPITPNAIDAAGVPNAESHVAWQAEFEALNEKAEKARKAYAATLNPKKQAAALKVLEVAQAEYNENLDVYTQRFGPEAAKAFADHLATTIAQKAAAKPAEPVDATAAGQQQGATPIEKPVAVPTTPEATTGKETAVAVIPGQPAELPGPAAVTKLVTPAQRAETPVLGSLRDQLVRTGYSDQKLNKKGQPDPNGVSEIDVGMALLEAAAEAHGMTAETMAAEHNLIIEPGTESVAAARKLESGKTRFGEFDTSDQIREVVRIFQSAHKGATLLHELLHYIRRHAKAEDLAVLEKHLGVKNGEWTPEQEDQFNRIVEARLQGKGTPFNNPRLQAVIDRFIKWLRALWKAIKRTGLATTPEVDAAVNRILGGTDVAVAKEKPPEAPPPAPTAQIEPIPPSFREWRWKQRGVNAGTMYPNRIGAKFTVEQIATLKSWAESMGAVSVRTSATKIEVTGPYRDGATFNLHQFGAAGVKSEAWAKRKDEIRQGEADRLRSDTEESKTRESYAWIVETFGEGVVSPYNMLRLSDFLEGKDAKYRGLPTARWKDGIEKAGALNAQGNGIDWGKLRTAYQGSREAPPPPSAEAPKAVEPAALPADPAPEAAPKGEKQPWEMRFVALANRKAEAIFPLSSKVEVRDGKPVYTYWTTVKWDGADRRFEIEGRSQPTATLMVERLHKKIVEQAIGEGKTVPPEVLADYPDIAAKYGKGAEPVTKSSEQIAVEFASNPKNLRKRLREGLMFQGLSAKEADKWTLDVEGKRMVSPDGTQAIVWQTRKYPDQPESYENQQTTVGEYRFKKIGGEVKPPAATGAETPDLREKLQAVEDRGNRKTMGTLDTATYAPLATAGYVERKGGTYHLTPDGRAKLYDLTMTNKAEVERAAVADDLRIDRETTAAYRQEAINADPKKLRELGRAAGIEYWADLTPEVLRAKLLEHWPEVPAAPAPAQPAAAEAKAPTVPANLPATIDPENYKRTTPAEGTPERNDIKERVNRLESEYKSTMDAITTARGKRKDELYDQAEKTKQDAVAARDLRYRALLEDFVTDPKNDTLNRIAAKALLAGETSKASRDAYDHIRSVMLERVNKVLPGEGNLIPEQLATEIASTIAQTPMSDIYQAGKYLDWKVKQYREEAAAFEAKTKAAEEKNKREADEQAKRDAEDQARAAVEAFDRRAAFDPKAIEEFNKLRKPVREALENLVGDDLNEPLNLGSSNERALRDSGFIERGESTGKPGITPAGRRLVENLRVYMRDGLPWSVGKDFLPDRPRIEPTGPTKAAEKGAAEGALLVGVNKLRKVWTNTRVMFWGDPPKKYGTAKMVPELAKKIHEYGLEAPAPTAETLLNPAALVNDLVILTDKAGNEIALKADYYQYAVLNHYSKTAGGNPTFSINILDAKHPELSPVAVFSGKKQVGVIMPVRLRDGGPNLAEINAKTRPAAPVTAPAAEPAPAEAAPKVPEAVPETNTLDALALREKIDAVNTPEDYAATLKAINESTAVKDDVRQDLRDTLASDSADMLAEATHAKLMESLSVGDVLEEANAENPKRFIISAVPGDDQGTPDGMEPETIMGYWSTDPLKRAEPLDETTTWKPVPAAEPTPALPGMEDVVPEEFYQRGVRARMSKLYLEGGQPLALESDQTETPEEMTRRRTEARTEAQRQGLSQHIVQMAMQFADRTESPGAAIRAALEWMPRERVEMQEARNLALSMGFDRDFANRTGSVRWKHASAVDAIFATAADALAMAPSSGKIPQRYDFRRWIPFAESLGLTPSTPTRVVFDRLMEIQTERIQRRQLVSKGADRFARLKEMRRKRAEFAISKAESIEMPSGKTLRWGIGALIPGAKTEERLTPAVQAAWEAADLRYLPQFLAEWRAQTGYLRSPPVFMQKAKFAYAHALSRNFPAIAYYDAKTRFSGINRPNHVVVWVTPHGEISMHMNEYAIRSGIKDPETKWAMPGLPVRWQKNRTWSGVIGESAAVARMIARDQIEKSPTNPSILALEGEAAKGSAGVRKFIDMVTPQAAHLFEQVARDPAVKSLDRRAAWAKAMKKAVVGIPESYLRDIWTATATQRKQVAAAIKAGKTEELFPAPAAAPTAREALSQGMKAERAAGVEQGVPKGEQSAAKVVGSAAVRQMGRQATAAEIAQEKALAAQDTAFARSQDELVRMAAQAKAKGEKAAFKTGAEAGKESPEVQAAIAQSERVAEKYGEELKAELTQEIIDFAQEVLPEDEYKRLADFYERANTAMTPGEYKALKASIIAVSAKLNVKAALDDVRAALKEAEEAKLRPEYRDRLQALLDGLTAKQTASKKPGSQQAAAVSLRQAESLLDAADRDAIGEIPQRVIDSAREVVKRNQGKWIGDMPPEDMQELADSIRFLVAQSKLKNRLIVQGRVRDAHQVMAEATREAVTRNGAKYPLDATNRRLDLKTGWRWLTHKGRELLVEDALGHKTKVQMIVGKAGTGHQVLFENPQKASEGNLRRDHDFKDRWDAELDRLSKLHGVDRSDLTSNKLGGKPERVSMPEATDQKGRRLSEVPMTLPEQMKLYAHSLDPDTREQLQKDDSGGISLTASRVGESVLLRNADLVALAAHMKKTPAGRLGMDFVRWFMEDTRKYQTDDLNAVWVEQTGQELISPEARTQLHFARERDLRGKEEELVDLLAQFADQASLKSQGILKARTGGNEPLWVDNFFSAAIRVRHLENAVITKLRAHQDAQRLLHNPDFKAAVAEGFKYGEDLLADLRSSMQDWQGVGRKAERVTLESLTRRLASLAGVGYLGLNPPIMIYQWASLFNLLNEIPYDKFARAVKRAALRRGQIQEEMREHSPFFREREMESGMQRYTPGAEFGLTDTWVSGKKPWRDKTMSAVNYTDMQVCDVAWEEAKIEADEAGLSGAAWWEFVNDRSRQVVEDTQATWDMLTTSTWTRQASKSAWVKLIMMFSSQNVKQFNMSARAIDDYRSLPPGERTAAEKAKLTAKIFNATVVNALGVYAIRYGWVALTTLLATILLGRKPDEKRKARGHLVRIAGDVVSSSHPLGGDIIQPALSVYKRMTGDKSPDFSRPNAVAGAIDGTINTGLDAISAFNEAMSGEKIEGGEREGEAKWKFTAEKAGREALGKGLPLFGVPSRGVASLAAPFTIENIESAQTDPTGEISKFRTAATETHKKTAEQLDKAVADWQKEHPQALPSEVRKYRESVDEKSVLPFETARDDKLASQVLTVLTELRKLKLDTMAQGQQEETTAIDRYRTGLAIQANGEPPVANYPNLFTTKALLSPDVRAIRDKALISQAQVLAGDEPAKDSLGVPVEVRQKLWGRKTAAAANFIKTVGADPGLAVALYLDWREVKMGASPASRTQTERQFWDRWGALAGSK